MPTPRILAFAGSIRRDSWNRKVLEIAAAGARNAGAEVTVINLADYPMPIYDADWEAAHRLPDGTKRLQEVMATHHGYLIACPEYNSSITPLLKNTIDWTTRGPDGHGNLQYWHGRTAGLVAASGGALGGLRVLRHVREILSNIGVLVIPDQRAAAGVDKVFDADGRMTDDRLRQGLESVGARLAQVTAKLL